MVQDKMKANKKAPAKHKAEDEYLLTTKLFCGKCESLMVGESGTSHMKNVHRYYKCVSVKHHRGCDKKSVKKDWIENLVIEQIRRVILDDDAIDRIADMVLVVQNKQNTVLPLLQKQYAQTQKYIDNLLVAMQQGIITESTKQRMKELEAEKNTLSVQIIKEEMSTPKLTKEQIIFWLQRFRKYNPARLDHRRRLIDSFVNAVFLYDDKLVITFNYKDGAKTISLAEMESSGICSDIAALGAPYKHRYFDTK